MELARKKNILNFFKTTSQTLAEKRDAVVTVLDFIDNICSTRSSLEELDRRSIAATARPHRIDHEWGKQVASSDATANWWTSGKPRPLQSTLTTSPPDPSQLPTSPTTASSSKAVATTTETTEPTEPAPRNNTKTKRENNSEHVKSGKTNKPPSGNTVPPRLSSKNQNRGYCNHCRRSGHTENSCLRRNKCTHCLRAGHSVQECFTRIAQERQKNFFRRISTEQAQNNALLTQTLSRFLPPASGPALTQSLTGNWAPGQRYISPQVPHPLHIDPAHVLTHQQPHFSHPAWSHAHP